MPSYRHHDNGDLYIQFEIDFPEPKWTDDDTIAKLEAILPPRVPLPAIADGHDKEEVVLADVDASKQARQENGHNHDDEDEEEGGPRMQCAQQ
jgi:DnaJ family protein A protein 2